MTRNSISIGLPLITAVMTLLAGCSADDADMTGTMTRSTVNMTASMLTTRTSSDVQDNTLSNQVTVGVYGLSDGDALLSNGDNAAYSVDGGSLVAVSSMYWPESGGITIHAYAPRQDGWSYSTESRSFTVAADQSSDEDYLSSDLLYAEASSSSRETVNLGFRHLMSRIVLTLMVEEGTSITNATVKITNTKPTAAFTPLTGVIGESSGSVRDIIIGTGVTVSGGSSTTLYGIIIPQTIGAETALIEVTEADKVWRYHFAEDVSFTSGKPYTLSVTVSAEKVTSTISGSATEPAL